MEQIFPKHISIRNKPKNLKPEDVDLFSHEFSVEIRETSLLQLRNVFILRDTIFDLRKIRFYLSHSHLTPLSKKQLRKRFFSLFRKGEKIERAIWIIDSWSNNYFHWLTDALPRLLAVEQFINTHLIILPREYEKYEYIKSSLNFLKHKIHFYNHKKVFVKNLLLPSHTALTGNYNKEILHQLRDRFQGINTNIPYRNIFISREKATKRKITNENEVVDLLQIYNFEVHFFEDYNFEQQVEIMLQTKTLIGLHGAGLTNMLFMPEKGNVLELRNRNDAHNNCYFSLASELGHQYYYQLNEGNSDNTNIVDVTVNLNELKATLEAMMNENLQR